jgi:hypothetical protein
MQPVVRKAVTVNKFEDSTVKFNGDVKEYELFRQKLRMDIRKSEAGHILEPEFEAPIYPNGAMARINQHNAGWQFMRDEDLERCEKKVVDFKKENNAVIKSVTIVNGVIEAGVTLHVMQTFEHITERQDITGLEKVKELLAAMDRKYRVFNDAAIISILAEMEALGYCQRDAEVLYLIETITALKARVMIVARATGIGQINAMSHQNLKIVLQRRLPNTVSYQLLKRDLDVGGRLYNATWEGIAEAVTADIHARIPSMEEEAKEMMVQYARVNAAAELEKSKMAGGGNNYGGKRQEARGGGGGFGGKRQPCYEWQEKKSCRFGDDCKFLHSDRGGYNRQGTSSGRGNRRQQGGDRSRSRERSPAQSEGKRQGVQFEKRVRPTQKEYNQAHATIAAFEQKEESGNETDKSET